MRKKKDSIYNAVEKQRVSRTEAKILVRGPRDVIEKFIAFRDENGFRNAWGAIEYLLYVEKRSRKKK